MKLLNVNLIYLTLWLILGILGQYYFEWDLTILLSCFGLACLLLYFSGYKNTRNHLFQSSFKLAVALAFSCLGAILLSLKSPEYLPNHYSHIQTNRQTSLLLRIDKRLKPSRYGERYYAEVLRWEETPVSGRVLVTITKDSSNSTLDVDDLILASTSLAAIQRPLHPHQFDYSRYLSHRGVHHQLHLNQSNYIRVSTSPQSIYGMADRLRGRISAHLKTAGLNTTSIQMINALLLGQKQDIDDDLYNNYINAGTVHILAVSGLHVGIILWVLTWLFKPLLTLKYGRVISAGAILICLWGFAITAGLSPSVTRAVTMFSLVSISLHLKRETNVFNTLILSAFVLLLIEPYYLFEVGFQLSYTAVLSIVSFQPLICGLWDPKITIVRHLWQIFGVTLAAQLGVAPLSLFYFHQFPGLFFVSNLVIVPVLGWIIGFGLLVIILSLLDGLPTLLAKLFDITISLLNDFIAWVSSFERFLLRDISFETPQVLLCYLLIISGFLAIRSKQFKWVVASLLCVLALEIYHASKIWDVEDERFLVFHKNRYSVIGIQKQGRLIVHHNLPNAQLAQQQFLANYRVGEGLREWHMEGIQKAYKTRTQQIFCLDSSGVYKVTRFKPSIILLQQSPKVNFERVIATLQPQQVIADGSNYKSSVRRWEKSCKTYNIPFHYTGNDGAFILED